jgi:hypothetical protein
LNGNLLDKSTISTNRGTDERMGVISMQGDMPDRREKRALGGISEKMSSCGLPMSMLSVHTAAENQHLSPTPYDEAEKILRELRCKVSLLEDQRDRAVETFCASPDNPELGRKILDLRKEIFNREYHTINGFIGNIKLQNPTMGRELGILNFKERQSQAEARWEEWIQQEISERLEKERDEHTHSKTERATSSTSTNSIPTSSLYPEPAMNRR